jgi:hypothetical protein
MPRQVCPSEGEIRKGAIYFARAVRAAFGFLGWFGRGSGGWGGLLCAKHPRATLVLLLTPCLPGSCKRRRQAPKLLN